MKILMIRHGEPDYALDCLTENGRREAALLAERIAPMDIAAYYASPMGRAQETCRITTDKAGREFKTLQWLHEFDIKLEDAPSGTMVQTWDLTPAHWLKNEELINKNIWRNVEAAAKSEAVARVDCIYKGLDELLAEYGYIREGNAYRVKKNFDGTIALYCHFGVTCVMISRLLNISPILACNIFSAEPTAVATLCTDDRFEGVVNFRLHGFGDISHLNKGENDVYKLNAK